MTGAMAAQQCRPETAGDCIHHDETHVPTRELQAGPTVLTFLAVTFFCRAHKLGGSGTGRRLLETATPGTALLSTCLYETLSRAVLVYKCCSGFWKV